MRNPIGRLAVAILAAAALLVPALPAGAIVGGAPDAGEHPYVGQLIFYVPEAQDPRFEDPGAWFKCTGTLIDADTVVTAGHCTYAVGVDGTAPKDPLLGGTDVWFSVQEKSDLSILKPSATYAPDRNDQRYADWSAALDKSATWHEARITYTHPDYVDAAFLFHDLGVVELKEPIVLPEYGSLPEEDYLDRYAGKQRQRGLFESVGYGLEDSGPKLSLGGDTRRKADRRLVSFRGAYGLRDIAVMFAHRGSGTTGGTCFGDSGGPTFDITTPQIADENIIVAVTSFGFNANCTAGGSYRIDQADDLEFLMDPAGAYTS